MNLGAYTTNKTLWPLAILGGAAAVCACVGIGGDFPLSDDWSYAYTVRHLASSGEIKFLPWASPSMVAQIWYGAFLSVVFGFSFELLRASTVVMAVAGVAAFFLVARRLTASGPAAALATAVFALCPLYVNLAFTFMTDVPALAVSLWAVYFYLSGLTERRPGYLFLGAVAASVALLIRQQGALVVVAAAIAALAAPGWSTRERARGLALIVALPALVFAGYHAWLFGVHGAPAGTSIRFGELLALSPLTIANGGFRTLCYLGLLLMPVAVALLPALLGSRRRSLGVAVLVLAACAVFLYLREGALMFYLTNILYDLGVGALTLRDTLFLGLPPDIHGGTPLALGLTIISAVAAGVLVTAWMDTDTRDRSPETILPLALLAVATAGALLQVGFYLDRYVLPLVPFALLVTLVAQPKLRPGRVSVALLAVLAWYAVAGTHDYMAWNRARHVGIEHLRSRGVSVKETDGGVEYNGWHLAAELGTWPTIEEARTGQPASRKSWWWVVDDR